MLDQPPLNFIDEVLTREYHDALKRAEASADCRVIILSGNGRGLPGGLNIKTVEAFGQEKMAFSEMPGIALKALSEAFSSEDSKEARLAFREKRTPNWRNK